MARNGIRVLDAELPVLEPYDGWSDRLPEPWRSRTTITAPVRGHLDTGNVGIQLDGKGWPLPDIGGADGKGRLVFRQGNRKYAECPDLARLRAEATPKAWLEGMDADGIDVAVLAPTVQLRLLAIDGVEPEHTAALCRAYNDYAAEFASHEPSRLKPWAWVPRQAPALAAEEARRAVEELGCIGVAMTTAGVDGTVLTDDAYEPLWSEIERLGVPLGLHLSGQCQVADDVGHRYVGHPRTEVVRMAVRLPFYAQTALAELILGGVLEHHPGMRVVLEEANVGWLPWLLWRMDEKWATYGPDQDHELSLSPTEYFLPPVLRRRRRRRVGRPPRHRPPRRRQHPVVVGLPPPRHGVAGLGRHLPRSARDQRRQQAQDPLGQRRQALRPRLVRSAVS